MYVYTKQLCVKQFTATSSSNVETSRNRFCFCFSSVQNLISDESSEESEPLLAREVISVSGDSNDVTIVQRRLRTSGGSGDSLNRIPSISSYYNITEIIEMGKMASLFFNKFGKFKTTDMSVLYLMMSSINGVPKIWVSGLGRCTFVQWNIGS